VPVMGVLAEGFYYLANELEDVLVESSQKIIVNFFQSLIESIKKKEYYRELYRLLGNDGGLGMRLEKLTQTTSDALVNEARVECDRYVRERAEFYNEETHLLFQLRQTLQQACRGYDYQSMIDAEPSIRQLLKIDFEMKVKDTIMRTFRQTINQTLSTHLLFSADKQSDAILQQYDHARDYLAQTLEKEAQVKLDKNRSLQLAIEQNIAIYNGAISSINQCLEMMDLSRKRLPIVSESDLSVVTVVADVIDAESFIVGEIIDSLEEPKV